MKRQAGPSIVVVLCLFLGVQSHAQTSKAAVTRPSLPAPAIRDGHYGPYERNVFDLWKADSAKPTPLLIYMHGGGFIAGDKSSLSPDLLQQCLKVGISVAAINYRYSSQAIFPAPFMDCARAVQFFRLHAGEWNLDPKHTATTGSSAGGGMSLWLAFHDDLADPENVDPVLRESTRLSCVAVVAAQCSYDPRFIKQILGGHAYEHPALHTLYGLQPGEVDTPAGHKMYEEASAINFLTAEDPPVFLYYGESPGPLSPDGKPGEGIHNPKFGQVLKEKMDALKVECVLKLRDDYTRSASPNGEKRPTLHQDMIAFLKKHFEMPPE